MKPLKIILFTLLLCLCGAGFAREVDINSSDAETIAASLKGIGMKKARAIVAYRESNGPFTSVEELVQVRGIGAKTVARIRDDVVIGKKATRE